MKIPVAIIGSGNIGTDLMMKVLRSSHLELRALVGIDPLSEGLARARDLGVRTSPDGLHDFLASAPADGIELFFDATSAPAHLAHASLLDEAKRRVVDLTPAACAPFVVPVANLDEHRRARAVNMVTCGGQATIPIVAALSRVAPVAYAEIVASIASRSAGPGTRANIDEFTRTTAAALQSIGGAALAKAIIILNPAEPPLIMRDTIHVLVEVEDAAGLVEAVENMVGRVARYVPGYRLVAPPVVEDRRHAPVVMPGHAPIRGFLVTTLLEVEGAGDFLPAYAGNLDIMTAAAVATAEEMVCHGGP